METAICRGKRPSENAVAQETASSSAAAYLSRTFTGGGGGGKKETCVSVRRRHRAEGASRRRARPLRGGKMAKTDKRGINFKTVQFNARFTRTRVVRIIILFPFRAPVRRRRSSFFFPIFFLASVARP